MRVKSFFEYNIILFNQKVKEAIQRPVSPFTIQQSPTSFTKPAKCGLFIAGKLRRKCTRTQHKTV